MSARVDGDGGDSGGRHVVLGVSGGIAAYKACTVLRDLTESGHEVTVVPTASALEFVGAATWEALSGNPVQTGVFERVHEVPHVRLGRQADLVLVVPATADLLARAATGRADDLLTATLLTASCPVLLVPAMHSEMWRHPATRRNAGVLRERGALVLEPAEGRLTGSDSGPGRLPEPAEISRIAQSLLQRGGFTADLAGRKVVVSAGGTREYLDPVRFLGNRSSGRQGYALAAAAAARGAQVTLVSANAAVPDPAGVTVVRVVSTEDMREAVVNAAAAADAVVMAAAPADFRPASKAAAKIKKTHDGRAPAVELTETPDVLAAVVRQRPAGQVVVGFAAETGDDTGDVRDHARAKLARKGCDLLVLNDVSGGAVFGSVDTRAVILAADGHETEVGAVAKAELAELVWDEVGKRCPPYAVAEDTPTAHA